MGAKRWIGSVLVGLMGCADKGTDSGKPAPEDQPPSIEMAAIDANARYYSDVAVAFQGRVSDAEDEPGELVVRAESDLDGELALGLAVNADGSVAGSGTLSEGSHSIRFVVVDAGGGESEFVVSLDVGPANATPSCTLVSPEDLSAAAVGTEVLVEGVVSDADIPAEELLVVISSDADGVLYEGAASSDGTVRLLTDALSTATHTLSMTAADELGTDCVSSLVYTVDEPPQIDIVSPSDGELVNEQDEVTFSATVADYEDDPADVSLVWSSDVDGELSTAPADSAGEVSFRRSDLSTGTHRISLAATDTHGVSSVVSVDLSINARPTAPAVALSPDPALTADDLLAVATGSVDPDDSGSVVYSYAWYEDGVLSAVSTTDTFPATDTTRDSTYRVVVTPSDGTGDGATGEAELTILNTPPVLTGPTLSASTVVVGDTLSCSATATDADDDTPQITFSWSDGSTGSTYSVTSTDEPGDTITCTATADDLFGGTATATASATMQNTAPAISSVTLDQSEIYTNDALRATVTASDADEDTLTITYDWYVDGTLTQSSTSNLLNGASASAGFDKTDSVYALISVSDGTDTTTATSSTLVVLNSPPDAPVIAVTPGSPTEGEELVCEVLTDSSDADEDSISYTMAWTVDGTTFSGTSTREWPGDTIDEGEIIAAEEWSCTATPSDGTDTGAEASASATVSSACTYALSFDGSNDYADFGEPASLDFTLSSSYSIELWVNVLSTPSDGATLYNYGDYESARDNRVLGASISSTGQLTVKNRGDDGTVMLQSSAALNLGQWYHVHVQQELGVGTRLYIDGVLEDSSTSTPGNISFSNSQEWTLGGRYYVDMGGYAQFLDGYISEFRVWSDIRSTSEILDAAAYLPVDPASESDLQGLWPLDEGTGTTLTDVSGNADDGTLINGSSWTSDCPTSR